MLLLMISYQTNRLLGCLFYNLSLIGFMIVVVGYGWTMLTEFLLCCLIFYVVKSVMHILKVRCHSLLNFKNIFPRLFHFII